MRACLVLVPVVVDEIRKILVLLDVEIILKNVGHVLAQIMMDVSPQNAAGRALQAYGMSMSRGVAHMRGSWLIARNAIHVSKAGLLDIHGK
jgi:hypothetical protein